MVAKSDTVMSQVVACKVSVRCLEVGAAAGVEGIKIADSGRSKVNAE